MSFKYCRLANARATTFVRMSYFVRNPYAAYRVIDTFFYRIFLLSNLVALRFFKLLYMSHISEKP